jgi:hypothetical protein
MPWIALALAALGADLDAATIQTKIQAPGVAVQGHYWRASSESFVVTSRHSAHDAREVARFCEESRARLQSQWCGRAGSAWVPRCHIVIHASASSYISTVGAGGSQTFGSSLISFGADKRPSRRQIDFRGDSPYGLLSVPHELTHVVTADLFGGRQPPRWADEGMAMLADYDEKQWLHYRDYKDALSRRNAYRAVELLSLDGHPHPSRVAAFYGQSLSLTSFLISRDSPATLVAFLQDALRYGHDAALRDRYGISNVAELEQLWHAHAVEHGTNAPTGAE